MANLSCPRCGTMVQADPGATPVCPSCGFSAPAPAVATGSPGPQALPYAGSSPQAAHQAGQPHADAPRAADSQRPGQAYSGGPQAHAGTYAGGQQAYGAQQAYGGQQGYGAQHAYGGQYPGGQPAYAPQGRPIGADGKPIPTEGQALACLLVNILVIPGVGSLIAGRTTEGIWQIVLWFGGAILTLVLIGFLIMPAAWIWGLVTGINAMQAAKQPPVRYA